ncbi:hypothetical protein B0F90DRAFT_206820 [Multifurca ochricompacta]|uniref:Transmembrane protein n=1 Tax=Multifurca ochricompacta TaxID=376703 RepID=A0AAD4M5H4_9AGAM|nr:hypothetical protein B0F90DRAFT_206820 [Multifurca ochricompacta]
MSLTNDQPRIADESSQKRLTAQETTALAKAADLQTLSRIIQIWSDRLQLISVYASFFTSIDSVLFSLSSSKGNGNATSKLMHASLVGALIFHAAAAILAYVASFILIRYRLNNVQSTKHTSNSPVAAVYARYAPPGSAASNQPRTPSALESGASGSHEKVGHGHISHSFPSSPVTPFVSTIFRPGHSPFFSTLSSAFSSLLHEPPVLDIDIRRVPVFNLSALVPCVGNSVHDDDPSADAEKNAIALVRLLNRCHNVCSIFALAGFFLVLTGIIAYLWAVVQHSVAIFGSACLGVCIVLGFAALH